MATTAPSPPTVLEAVDALGPPGTPVTTAEVAEGFNCTQRTVYNRLDSLADDGALRTKKVGANSRVWWRPPAPVQETGRSLPAIEEGGVHPVFNAEMVGVIVWGNDFTISEANDAFLKMADLTYEEALGTSWRELTPEEFYEASKRHIEQIDESGRGVAYEKQYYRGDGSRWWGLFESQRVTEDEIVEFVVDITERKATEEALRESEAELACEVGALRELQEISTELIREDDTESLSDQVLEAAIEIMNADFASVQLYDPERNDLELVTHRGFDETAESALARVGPEGCRVCSEALKTGERVVVSDVESCTFVAGTASEELYRQNGIRAAQTTPLVSRNGDVLGMFSTHWETPHELSERDLGRLDILARQTADLVQHQLDVETLTQTNRSLERLNATSTELIDAEVAEIPDRAASLARDVLGVEYAVLWQYDEVAGELRERASSTGPSTDGDEIQCPDGLTEAVWQTFIGERIAISNDCDELDGPTPRSRALVPLGRHGVLCVGSRRPGAFDDRLVDLTQTVATTIETAWDRAEGQQQLASRNAELERLDELNALIRAIGTVIVDADSPDAIEQSVCDRLAGSGLYEFAWIGGRDPDSETIVPRAWAGVDDGYVENLAIPTEDEPPNRDPIAAAIGARELQAVEDVATDSRAAAWREATLERGARSCVSIPLVYDASPYGVLTVYADRPQCDDRNRDVLADLGEIIAHAMAAAETRRTLRSDNVTELALEIGGQDDALKALAREGNCEIEFDGFVPSTDGAPRVFFTAPAEAAEAVLTAARRDPGIRTIQPIRDEDEAVTFEASVTGSTVAAHLVGNRGVIRSLTVDADYATAVVDLPATLPVREFLDTVRTAYPDIELVGRTTRERRITRRQHLQDAIAETLTPRQREVVETAYRSGFFESPRIQTGQELADGLDISQSTFTHHLREGERKVFELVFENA